MVAVQRNRLMVLVRILYQRERTYANNDMCLYLQTYADLEQYIDLLVSLLAAKNVLICHSFEGHL